MLMRTAETLIVFLFVNNISLVCNRQDHARNIFRFACTFTRDLSHGVLIDRIIAGCHLSHIAREEARSDAIHIDMVGSKICGAVIVESSTKLTCTLPSYGTPRKANVMVDNGLVTKTYTDAYRYITGEEE